MLSFLGSANSPFVVVGGEKLRCPVRGDLKTDQPLEVRKWDGWWPLKTRYLRFSAGRGEYSTISTEHVLNGLDSPSADEIACRPVITDFRLDGTFNMMKKWLIEYDHQHEDCFQNLPATKLPPTHLINVQASMCDRVGGKRRQRRRKINPINTVYTPGRRAGKLT